MIMLRWAVVALAASLCAQASFAQNRRGTTLSYQSINLASTEEAYKIELRGDETNLDINQILVGKPQHSAATQIIIARAKNSSDPSPRPINVRINDIQSSLGSNARLILNFADDVMVGKLEITRNAADIVDPTVEMTMAATASVTQVSLVGGRYRSIMLRPRGAGQPAEINISRVRIADLMILGGDAEQPQPVRLTVNAELAQPLYNVREDNFTFDNIQLRGDTAIALSTLSQLGPSTDVDCSTAGRSLSFRASRVTVGDTRGRLDKSGTFSVLDLRLDEASCLTLQLTDINLFGDMYLKGGVLSKLALDNVDDHLGGKVTLEFSGVHTLQLGAASLNRVALVMPNQASFGQPEILKWGYVRINESVSFPQPVFDALSTSLQDSPDDSTSAGIRNFLVDVRWKSFSSEVPERRAAPAMLFAVLNSDARQIFGPCFATFLWFTTGYGQKLYLPAICLCLLLAIPLLISCFKWLISKVGGQSRWIDPRPYYSALVAGDNAALLTTSPGLKYVVPIHRLVIAIEVGLVTLFIQNAVLTGS